MKISEPLQAVIAEWRDELAARPDFAHPATASIRWLAGKNLHITLIPPWYEQSVEPVVESLGTVVGHARPFDIQFRTVTYGPNPRRPRLIWATGDAPEELALVKSRAERALNKPSEQRPFLLHLTLARFRPEDFSRFPVRALDEAVSWGDEVRSIVLMESRLSRHGADYEVLEEVLF